MSEPSPSRGGDDNAAGADSLGGGDPTGSGGGGKPYDEYDDPMAPPREPCECWCLHCERVFMSSAMWFQRVIGARDGFHGFWMCPTPNCSGAGFTFDIFPTDPDHPANAGWHTVDDEDDELLFDEDGNPVTPADLDPVGEWDPDEPRYKQLDADFEALDDEDLEGEEWKHGLAPGERPAASEFDAMSEARRQWEEEQKRYDMPDERPRVLDWSDREDRGPDGPFSEDDIPF